MLIIAKSLYLHAGLAGKVANQPYKTPGHLQCMKGRGRGRAACSLLRSTTLSAVQRRTARVWLLGLLRAASSAPARSSRTFLYLSARTRQRAQRNGPRASPALRGSGGLAGPVCSRRSEDRRAPTWLPQPRASLLARESVHRERLPHATACIKNAPARASVHQEPLQHAPACIPPCRPPRRRPVSARSSARKACINHRVLAVSEPHRAAHGGRAHAASGGVRRRDQRPRAPPLNAPARSRSRQKAHPPGSRTSRPAG